jgi:hypothetical protein
LLPFYFFFKTIYHFTRWKRIKFFLNSQRLTVTIKKPLPQPEGNEPKKKNDNFILSWTEEEDSSDKPFSWFLPLQNRFTPENILDQLAENGITLKQKWLILDEFDLFL